MKIFVNDKPMDIEDIKYISEIFAILNMKDPKEIAIAVNDQVISKDRWSQYPLKNKDRITIIKATAGG